MTIEEAKYILTNCISDNCEECEYYENDEFRCINKHDEAISTLLTEIDKLDRVREKLKKDIDKNTEKYDKPIKNIEFVEKKEYAQQILEELEG